MHMQPSLMNISIFQGSLVWFDGNVGYLLPGKLLSFVGKDVKVQHELTGDVRIYFVAMFVS